MIFFKDICLLVQFLSYVFFFAYVYLLKHYILILFPLDPAVSYLIITCLSFCYYTLYSNYEWANS